jgi:hypothetical protein
MSKRPLNKRHKLMLRWGVATVVVGLVLGLGLVLASAREDPTAPEADGSIAGLTSILSRAPTPQMLRLRFEDVTEASGVRFEHFPAERRSLLPEDMGSGVAWGDYDDDGDPDLFLVNFCGSILEPVPEGDATQGRCALYRNDGDGRFTDVSRAAGVDVACFGLGAAWGDYDNDDDLDLYVTCYGRNLLFRNDGDVFTDVTEVADVGDEGFGAGCAWADYDGDGFIDLYVCNYVDFEYQSADRTRTVRQYGSEIPYTINPSAYPPASNRFYRNNGDGTFTDVATDAGIANPTGRSLGAAWFDFDLDGLIDLYVANDVSANGVFRNMGDGTFADIGASSLAADYRGAMGLAVGDYEPDGDLDLFVTHWVAQENAFFENMAGANIIDAEGNARLFFMDIADMLGLGQLSLRMVGWATGFADFDNDGLLDLWVVNGNTLEEADDNRRLKPQHVQVFRQEPDRGFFEMAEQSCPSLGEPIVGRGGAQADFDGDGRVDLAFMVHGEGVRLLRNTAPSPGHWLGVRLRQPGGNTRAIGARVEVTCGSRVQTAQAGADGSYLSQSDGILHFGLGPAETVDELTITWPDGTREVRHDPAVDQVTTMFRGDT